MKQSKKLKIFRILYIFIFPALFSLCASDYPHFASMATAVTIGNDSIINIEKTDTDNIVIRIATFLGNEKRNYYGNKAPERLDVLWKLELGGAKTRVSKNDIRYWRGAGWTGQPLFITEDSVDYLIQGAYDYHLRKIRAKDGSVVWKYKFDDMLKGTGTIWKNTNDDSINSKYVIMQGSRLGYKNRVGSTKCIPSFRAVSYITGKELWRMNSVRTRCYSRDVDASALVLNDTAYIGLENGYFTVFNPDYRFADTLDGIFQPKIYQQDSLFEKSDIAVHKGNLVTESSPSLLRNHIYITSGSGHVYGFNLETKTIDWDFFIGSDMDGSPVVTSDSCILVSVEKQYISGKGGVFKLNPSKSADSCVVWYFPTENKKFASWLGGIVGSVGINDSYYHNDTSNLAAFLAMDGYLYVVDHKSINKDTLVDGPNKKHKYHPPELVYKKKNIGPSIATPIIVNNRLVATGYHGIYLFEFDENYKFTRLDHKNFGGIESTPIAIDNRIYVACRNGFLYCFGEKEAGK